MTNSYNDPQTNHGQGLIEYALILALVALVTVLGLSTMGTSVADVFCRTAAAIGAKEVCSEGCQDGLDNLDGWDTNWGKFEAKEGKMCNSGGWGSTMNRCSGELPTNDYNIKLEGTNLERGNGYGVWFRASKNDRGRQEGYIFQYDPGYAGGAFLFRKWINGRETRPFAGKIDRNFDFHGEDHDVEVVVEGNVFKAYIDDKLVLEATDDTYTSGQAGLRTWDGTAVCLDDFSMEPTWP